MTHPRVSKTGRHHAAKGHALHPRKTSTHPRGHSTHHTSAHHRLAGQHHTIHHHRLRHGVVIHHRRPPGAAGPHHGRRHVRPALISARTRHKRTGYLRPKRAVHATYKIRVRRKPRTHRVWSRHR